MDQAARVGSLRTIGRPYHLEPDIMSTSKTRHQCHEPLITGNSFGKTIVHSGSLPRFRFPDGLQHPSLVD